MDQGGMAPDGWGAEGACVLKLGSLVRVYQKPFSNEDFEGFARIRGTLSYDAEQSRYRVQFVKLKELGESMSWAAAACPGDGAVYERIVMDSHLVGAGEPPNDRTMGQLKRVLALVDEASTIIGAVRIRPESADRLDATTGFLEAARKAVSHVLAEEAKRSDDVED